MDTPNRRGNGHGFYSSYGSNRFHGHHHYHPYKRSERGYFLDEFKKAKPPTFDGELKKPKYAEEWLLGMKKLFELHDYIENMKVRIDIFSIKGKSDIWWEYVKYVKDIRTKDLRWHEFKRILRKKYLLERYYDSKAKDFYEMNMGLMIDEEYTSMFMEDFRYVP